MTPPDVTRRERLKRAALAIACVALAGMAWAGYRTGESQAAWAALWSLCAPPR